MQTKQLTLLIYPLCCVVDLLFCFAALNSSHLQVCNTLMKTMFLKMILQICIEGQEGGLAWALSTVLYLRLSFMLCLKKSGILPFAWQTEYNTPVCRHETIQVLLLVLVPRDMFVIFQWHYNSYFTCWMVLQLKAVLLGRDWSQLKRFLCHGKALSSSGFILSFLCEGKLQEWDCFSVIFLYFYILWVCKYTILSICGSFLLL